jgi:ABC-type methionine transport system ATPase subunit
VRQAKDAFRRTRMVLFQLDTPLKTVAASVALATAAGVRVVLNPAPARPLPAQMLKRVYLLTPNESEAELLTDVTVTDETTAGKATDKLLVQGKGVGIIYVSNRMDEIRRIADRITLMRDGRPVATHHARDVTPAELVCEMVGHDLPARKSAGERATSEVALRVRHLRVSERVRDVSFEVRRGEILGIAGLIGAGRTETLGAIFGADAKDRGEIFVGGQPVVIRSPMEAVRTGIGLVPEDRKRDGLLPSHPSGSIPR